MGRAGLFCTKPKLSAEVLIRMTALLEFARHSSHKANNDFLHSGKALDPDKTPLEVLGIV
jgi:hypothetical protein